MGVFDLWMHAWMLGPGALTILWVSESSGIGVVDSGTLHRFR